MRTLFETRAVISVKKVNPSANLSAWLVEQAGDAHATLLAHADDGVVWGVLDRRRVITGCDAAAGTKYEKLICEFTPELRLTTLHTLRLFNEDAEGMLWHDLEDGEWRWRWLYEAKTDDAQAFSAFDEAHILWGTQAQPLSSGFTLMADGAQGLRHVVPLALPRSEWALTRRPLRLYMRHYLQPDETGFARVVASRLRKLDKEQ